MCNIAATGKDNVIKGFSRFDKGGGMCIYVSASEKLNVTITAAKFEEMRQSIMVAGCLFRSLEV